MVGTFFFFKLSSFDTIKTNPNLNLVIKNIYKREKELRKRKKSVENNQMRIVLLLWVALVCLGERRMALGAGDADLIENEAMKQQHMGNFNEAIYLYHGSLELYRQMDNGGSNVAQVLKSIAECYAKLGQWLQAVNFFHESYEMYRQLEITVGVINELDVVNVLNQLGDAECEIGEFDQAKQRYQKALEILNNIEEETSPQVAYQLDKIGSVLDLLEEYDQALDHKEKALIIREAINNKGDDNLDVAESLRRLGDTHNRMGEDESQTDAIYHTTQSIGFYERAFGMYDRLGQKQEPGATRLAAQVKNLIGLTYTRLREYKKARDEFNIALNTLKRASKPGTKSPYEQDMNQVRENLRRLNQRTGLNFERFAMERNSDL